MDGKPKLGFGLVIVPILYSLANFIDRLNAPKIYYWIIIIVLVLFLIIYTTIYIIRFFRWHKSLEKQLIASNNNNRGLSENLRIARETEKELRYVNEVLQMHALIYRNYVDPQKLPEIEKQLIYEEKLKEMSNNAIRSKSSQDY